MGKILGTVTGTFVRVDGTGTSVGLGPEGGRPVVGGVIISGGGVVSAGSVAGAERQGSALKRDCAADHPHLDWADPEYNVRIRTRIKLYVLSVASKRIVAGTTREHLTTLDKALTHITNQLTSTGINNAGRSTSNLIKILASLIGTQNVQALANKAGKTARLTTLNQIILNSAVNALPLRVV